jgi:hypothetical protein
VAPAGLPFSAISCHLLPIPLDQGLNPFRKGPLSDIVSEVRLGAGRRAAELPLVGAQLRVGGSDLCRLAKTLTSQFAEN